MSKLKRFRIWFCINFLGIWVWPSVKMDFVQITSYPVAPYETAKLLRLSPWDYWKMTETAMSREAAAMLDILGFTSEPSQLGKDVFKAGIRFVMTYGNGVNYLMSAHEERTVFDHDRFPDKLAHRRYIHY